MKKRRRIHRRPCRCVPLSIFTREGRVKSQSLSELAVQSLTMKDHHTYCQAIAPECAVFDWARGAPVGAITTVGPLCARSGRVYVHTMWRQWTKSAGVCSQSCVFRIMIVRVPDEPRVGVARPSRPLYTMENSPA